MNKEKKPVALVLGGTNPHKALVENLKGRGYYTILIDYLPYPPAAAVADQHLQVSALDHEEVLKVAREHNAELVISVCLDRTIPVVAEVSAVLSLPSVYTPENSARFTDKALMKQVFLHSGIPCARDIVAKSPDEIISSNLRFPLVLKPTDATGSLGITFVEGHELVEAGFDAAAEASTSSTIIAEEFLYGREFSLDCIVTNGVCNVLLIRERLKKTTPEGSIQCYATIAPAELNNAGYDKIVKVIDLIPKAFGLNNVPLLIQGIYTESGVFNVLEIAVRLGGGPSSFRTVHMITSFDLLDAAVDCNLGKSMSMNLTTDNQIYTSTNLYVTKGKFSALHGVDDLLKNDVIREYYSYKPVGTTFSDIITARNRVGAVILCASSHHELYNKIKRMYANLEVLDENGNDMLEPSLKFEIPSSTAI